MNYSHFQICCQTEKHQSHTRLCSSSCTTVMSLRKPREMGCHSKGRENKAALFCFGLISIPLTSFWNILYWHLKCKVKKKRQSKYLSIVFLWLAVVCVCVTVLIDCMRVWGPVLCHSKNGQIETIEQAASFLRPHYPRWSSLEMLFQY